MAGKEDQIKTEIAVDGEQEYKKACKEIDASLKAIASEMKVVSATFEGNADSIEAMTAKQDVLNKRLEEQKKKVAEAEAALKKYQDAGQGTSEAAKKMETNLNYARAAMIKTENEIRNLDAGLEEARNASNDFSDGLEDISQEAESTGGALDGLGGKVSSVAGALGTGLKTIGVGVAAIGTAMVAGIGYAVGFADEVKGAMNDFEASTGIAEAAANGFEDAMLRIYNNNFGESMDDIAASMATVAQTSGEVDPTKIEELTQNALMLRDTFGFDIQEQMRAVNMLMDQFGLSGEEAFNLIAQGAQNGLDKNGDLLDSINEYSVHFKSLGLDAEDMVKEKLGIKFYGRYMDDFYLIHEDKEYLRYCWKEIERHVNELGLSLNAKTNIYPLKNGIDFLGFHSYLTESGAVIRKVRRKSKNNARRRLTKMRGLLEAGKITPEKVEQSYQSWRGHASKGNCYHLIRNMDQHYNKLFGQCAAAGNRGGVAVSEEKEEGKECRNN